MRIGTPLSAGATRVMLLGSGELGKEVIIALQRLGVETIAVDRYENAPGHQVAHRAYTIDMTNGAAIRELVERERPNLIVPEIEAIATQTLLELEQEQGVEVIPTARAARLTMNREGIRRLAAEDLGLPCSRFAFAESLAQLKAAVADGIGFPCFIKPVMSSSGKGQSLVHNADELDQAWEYAGRSGRVDQGMVIVEQKIEFDFEITLLTVRTVDAGGQEQTFFCEPIGHRQEQGDYVESWQPQPMSETALSKAKDIAHKVTGNLGGRGIFGVELFVRGDEVWFSEVSPRPHDTGMVTMISQYQSEFDLHARAILGLPVDTQMSRVGASAVIYGGRDERGIVFDGVEQALAIEGTDLRLFGKPESFRRRRMGVALATAADTEIARDKARRCAALVKTGSGHEK